MSPKLRSSIPSSDPLDDEAIDELYGLEPQFVAVQCPHCGEQFETAVDLSAGSFRYVEDCQVCCQPIELTASLDEDGGLERVTASRS